MKRGPSKRSRSDSMESNSSMRRNSVPTTMVGGAEGMSPHHRASFGSASGLPGGGQSSNSSRLAAISSPVSRYERLPSIDTLTGAGGLSPKASTSSPSTSSSSWQQQSQVPSQVQSQSQSHNLPTPPQQQQHSPLLAATSPLPFPSVITGVSVGNNVSSKPRASSFNLPIPSTSSTGNVNNHPNSHGNNYFSKASSSSSAAAFRRSTRHSSISSVESFEADGSNYSPTSSSTRSNSNSSMSINDITLANGLNGWNDRYIDSYYQLIHPTLPVLPSSKLQLRTRLEKCPSAELRFALLSCISGLIYSSENSRNINEIQFYRNQTLQGLGNTSSSTFEDKNTEILRLMTLILFYLQTRQSCWLGAAISQAYGMSLHVRNYNARHGSAGSSIGLSGGNKSGSVSPGTTYTNEDSDDVKISRRLFLVLVILDRMHTAVYPNMPLQIPDQYINSDQDDLDSFDGNRSNIEMIRLCMNLGRVSKLVEESRGLAPESRSVLRLCGDLDAIGRSLEGLWDTVPILKAVYYFARLILDRVAPTANIINDSTTLGFLMDSPLVSVSPFLAYFIPVLVETITTRSHEQSKSAPPSIQTEMNRLYEFLDRTIERKFPEYEKLIRKLREVQSQSLPPQQQNQQPPTPTQQQHTPAPPTTTTTMTPPILLLSNHQRLEGLAHVAHLAER